MIVDYFPEGRLALHAVTPLSSPFGEHYWDEEHEILCDVYWHLAELIAVVYHMEVVGYNKKAGVIVIAPKEEMEEEIEWLKVPAKIPF